MLQAKSKNSTIVFEEPLRASLWVLDLSAEEDGGIAEGMLPVSLPAALPQLGDTTTYILEMSRLLWHLVKVDIDVAVGVLHETRLKPKFGCLHWLRGATKAWRSSSSRTFEDGDDDANRCVP